MRDARGNEAGRDIPRRLSSNCDIVRDGTSRVTQGEGVNCGQCLPLILSSYRRVPEVLWPRLTVQVSGDLLPLLQIAMQPLGHDGAARLGRQHPAERRVIERLALDEPEMDVGPAELLDALAQQLRRL